MSSPQEKLREFLLQVWGQEPAKVFLAQKPTQDTFKVVKPQVWPDKSKDISEWIYLSSDKGTDVYFSPALYKDDATNKRKESVIGSRVLWVDIDGNVGEAREKLAASGLPVPSARIASGSKDSEHWYWYLDSQINTETLEALNRKIAYYLNADIGCWSAEHVLRPPFTNNHKHGKTSPVDFVDYTGETHQPGIFDTLPGVQRSLMETMELGEIPPTGRVIAKYTWDEQHLDIWENPVTEKGGRSDSMVRIAYFLAEQGATDEEIYSIVYDLDERIGKFKGRTDRKRRLVGIVQKVRIKYPYGVSTIMEQTSEDTKFVYGLKELLESDFRIEWLIDELIPLHTINYISAPPGAGKSRISLQLADAAVRGTKFLQWDIKKRVEKIMFLSLEMDGPMLKHFVASLSEGKEIDGDIDERFMFVPVGNAITFDKPEGYKFVETLIKDYAPDMVFIDALGKMTLDNLEEKQAKTINMNLLTLIAKYNVTFFIIHHNRKAEKSAQSARPSLADVYGNQYIMADAATAFSLWKPDNQKNMEFVPLKVRAGMEPEPLPIDGSKGFEFVVREDSGYDEPDFDDIGLS